MSEPDYYAQEYERTFIEEEARQEREELFNEYLTRYVALAKDAALAEIRKNGLPDTGIGARDLADGAFTFAKAFVDKMTEVSGKEFAEFQIATAKENYMASRPVNANPEGGLSPDVYDSVGRDHEPK